MGVDLGCSGEKWGPGIRAQGPNRHSKGNPKIFGQSMSAPSATPSTAPTAAELTATADGMGISIAILDCGKALYNGNVDTDAALILNARGLDLTTRHFFTLECVTTLDLHTLRNLGCAHGLDLRSRTGDVIKYARMVLALDTLPGQVDPGPVLKDGAGRTMTPQALAQPLARAVAEADLEIRKLEAAALTQTGAPMGLPMGGGGGGGVHSHELVDAIKEVTGERAGAKPKAVTVPEITTIRQDVEAQWGFVPLKTEHGDGKALGQARY